jgi:putative tryptophan/tyrosine transport system substrate-binding protein
MKRREVLKLLAGAAIGPLDSASAQSESKTYRIGLLSRGAIIADASPIGAALIRALGQRGYSIGRNLAFERRGAEMHVELLPRMVDELVASKVDVIFAVSYPAALAAKKGTTLPVVVFSTGDPVGTGLVDSLARPGGNITGISDLTVELSPKRLQLLKEMTPGLRRVAMLWNAADPGMTLRYRASEAAAQELGITVEPLGLRDLTDFERAFAGMTANKPDAILIVTDGLTIQNRRRVLEFASTNQLPALYEELDFLVRDGGLMFYGPDTGEIFERVASLIDRILKGAKPQDLPFEQPTRFRFIINLTIAKALGLTIPQSIMLLADEVIE